MPHAHGQAIALSCGDPAGIGPEIAVKAWQALKADVPFFWIGDPAHLPADTPVARIETPGEAAAVAARALPVLALDFPEPVSAGAPSAANAPAVVEAVRIGAKLAMEGAASALCTCPISKKVLVDWAGFSFPGHTEYLADFAGVDHVVMMLACDTLKVVPATIHIPLKDVPAQLTAESLERTLLLTNKALQADLGIKSPRIAVAGLNPHAGEGGLLGSEDNALIAPVLAKLAARGLDVRGPLPADTMFHARAREGYDAAVAMYHDQALIPIKTLAFDLGVNVTLGLPFVRTSPDHGTAFDIAGTGIASPTSLIEALKLAQVMARNRAP